MEEKHSTHSDSDMLHTVVEIYETRFNSLVFSAMRVLRDQSESQDVVQSTILRILKNPSLIENVTNPVAYLHMAVIHVAINAHKKRQFSTPVDPEAMYNAFVSISSEVKDESDIDQQQEWIRRVLVNYPEHIVDAYIRHIFNDDPIKQLAEELDIKPNTLSQHFRRMRLKLAEHYSKSRFNV